MRYSRLSAIILLTVLLSCERNADMADAYGNFEAIEVIVSAETQGRITEFNPGEGETLALGEVVTVIDTMQLFLKRKQLQSVIAALPAKIRTLDAQVHASHVQLENLQREKERIDRLYEGGAATSKQQDDISGQIALINAQILAVESQKASIYAERNTLNVQVEQVNDQILKCSVQSPMNGIMLIKYKEAGEIAVPGQPLFKIANLDNLILRAYVSGNQLSRVNVGKPVTVSYDVPGGTEETTGQVSWISSRAEFTPKIIQTREERVSLVYALKVSVPNDGTLKIGMPGEVTFP